MGNWRFGKLEELYNYRRIWNEYFSLTLSVYVLIFILILTYSCTKESNLISEAVFKQIRIEKSKTDFESQERKYVILIMFQQASFTLILLSVPVAVSLYQFRVIRKRLLKKEEFRKRIHQRKSLSFESKIISMFPKLSAYDIKLCELLMGNESSKVIAEKLNITPASVNTARYRLRRKLKVPKDQELLTFLHSI